MSAFGEQVSTLRRQEQVQQELETCTEDMDKYSPSLSFPSLRAASSCILILPQHH